MPDNHNAYVLIFQADKNGARIKGTPFFYIPVDDEEHARMVCNAYNGV